MSNSIRNAVRLGVVVGLSCGTGLLIDHIAHYGCNFHLAVVDHGVWGIGLIVLSLAAGIGVFQWKKGN